MFFFDYFIKKETVANIDTYNNEEKSQNNDNNHININIEAFKNRRSFDQIASPFENNAIKNKRVSLDERVVTQITSLDEIKNKRVSLDERETQITSLDEIKNKRVSLDERKNLDVYNGKMSSLEYKKHLKLNKEMNKDETIVPNPSVQSDLESNFTFKSKESDKTNSSSLKSKTPHQLRYMNSSKKPENNENNDEFHKFFDNIVDGEYKRKELYTSEQYEGWCPILTNSNTIKK